MHDSLRELFRELADIPPKEREQIFAERQIPAHLRAEVESLLQCDSPLDESLTRRVSEVAAEVLHQTGSEANYCGAYRLVQLLGSGGMGTVYLAERHDGEIEQKVAIKLLRADADRPAWRDRFLRERQLLAYLNHSSIARLLDAGHTEDGRPYLVMEYVDGAAIDKYAETIDLHAKLRLFLLVCDGVAHAHRHLIVHRDLKPSNILVDSTGRPKLLDFGIAKLLDLSGDETQTVERLLTPNYASPEQLRGEVQTTATDIYSLGAVLHKLLTGRTPRELLPQASATSETGTSAGSTTGSGGSDLKLPRDIDCILRKALRHEPDERYASVDAFADDIRAFLESRPVAARSGNAWYRTRKFLRRSWIPVSATALAIASLSSGIWIAHRQRIVAERRFNDVRQLSNKLFDIDRQVLGLPGGSKTRQFIVDTSLEYLRRLSADVGNDSDLALDVGTAYMRVGRVQGVPISPNLGQMENAEQNLQIAEKLIHSVLEAQPSNRMALLRAAQVAHDRMVLAEYRHPDTAALPLAFQSEEWLNKYLEAGPPDEAVEDQVLLIGTNVGNWYMRKDLTDRALQLLRRTIEIAKTADQPRHVASAQIIVARVLRGTGDLDGALAAAREAVSMAKPPPGDQRMSWFTTLALALSTQGSILGEDNAINLARPREAADYFERGFRIHTNFAKQDANDALSRLNSATHGIRLGNVVRHSDPHKAISIYDEILQRLAEVANNSRARREEIRALAGSTYPLRRLGKSSEARKRLEAAFSRLSQLKLYPAEQVELGSEPDDALRALAEYEAHNGNIRKGIEIYQQLLDQIKASDTKPESRLTDAAGLSSIYAATAALHSALAKLKQPSNFVLIGSTCGGIGTANFRITASFAVNWN